MAARADKTTSAEVKAILEHEYEDCSALAKSAHETAQMAQHRLWNSLVTTSSEATTHDSEDLDEEDKRLSILGKRARNSLSKLAIHVAEPAGG